MILSRARSSSWRPFLHLHRRFSEKLPKPEVGYEAKDWRGPWLYRTVGVGHFVVIPLVIAYAALFYDWNDDKRGEHVMLPVRRWLETQKAAFYKLSPSEQQLAAVEGQSSAVEAPSDTPATSGLSTAGLPKGFFKPYFMVRFIQPDGPAATAGLLDEDLIVSFGNIPVRDLPPLRYHAILTGAANNDAVIPVVVVRGEREIEIVIKPQQGGELGCELERYQPGQVKR